jgi:hypothetical protein
MADIPADRKIKKQPEVVEPGKIVVTHENADLLTVHFLSQIFARLGYVIKLLEEKK